MRMCATLAVVMISLAAGGPAAAVEWPVVYDDAAKPRTTKTATDSNAQAATEADQAKLELTAVEPAKPAPPPVTLKLEINLTSQRLTVRENGAAKHTWKISSGRGGYLTPTGNYRPQWMARMWHSRKYDGAPMPHSIFFHRGFAIHATYATGRLGRPASHGCIRLSPRNAKTLYRLVSRHGKVSTRISIRGHAKQYRQRVAKKRRYRPQRRSRQLPPGYVYSYRRPPRRAYGYRRPPRRAHGYRPQRRYRQVYRYH